MAHVARSSRAFRCVNPDNKTVVPDSLTKQQAAELLQVSPRQVQRWIAERKLRACRLSHKVLRIRRIDVERFLERSTA